MTAGKFTSCYNAVKVRSHYDAGGAPVRDQASTGMNRGHTGMNRCSTGMNSRRPGTTGAPPSPVRTDNDRRGTLHRDPNRPRQSYGEPGECRQSPGIATVHN
ncbi:hypothetical protein DPMN_124891 [Dreissena polymorpha]|uniref:Uncharacterized protein n=1 Tax=Dreissena polymorpha TaxID=45954 RepID=A0A9D4GWH1_DREPO|nr:hypothetical protein DPMN_124891 [Dreissena polymorpha]